MNEHSENSGNIRINEDDNIIVTEHLIDNPINDLENFELFDGRFSYLKNQRIMRFKGQMSIFQKLRLKRVSNNSEFQRGVNELHRRSNLGSVNSGETYVRVFKWALVILSALIFQRIIEGICYSITGKRFFTELFIWLPKQIVPSWIAQGTSEVNLKFNSATFLVGVFQFITTLFFLIRYFLCLIDGIERAAGITRHTNFQSSTWIERLRNVGIRSMFGNSVISLIEFLLIYLAVLAIPSPSQWLFYLLFLVVIDSIWFLGPRTARLVLSGLSIVFCFFTSIIIIIIISIVKAPSVFMLYLKKEKSTQGSSDTQESRFLIIPRWIDSCLKWLHERIRRSWKNFSTIVRDYGLWNLLDFITLGFGLYWLTKPGLIRNFIQLILNNERLAANLEACFFVLVATILVSALNFIANRKLYQTHISFLRLQHTGES